MPIDEVLKYIGLLGAFLYLASYFLLQAGYIGGNSKAYTYLNLSAASLVLVSLTTAFNAASVVIQVSWILISIFGMSRMYLLYRRIRFDPFSRRPCHGFAILRSVVRKRREDQVLRG